MPQELIPASKQFEAPDEQMTMYNVYLSREWIDHDRSYVTEIIRREREQLILALEPLHDIKARLIAQCGVRMLVERCGSCTMIPLPPPYIRDRLIEIDALIEHKIGMYLRRLNHIGLSGVDHDGEKITDPDAHR